MSSYSIKDLERISGIKAHTLRIWEQRYNIINPCRTETNIRHYDDSDLRAVLNISILNNNGYKISKIAQMNTAQIAETVLKVTDTNFTTDVQIDNMIIAMVEMDEERFEKYLSANILRLGFEKTYSDIIYPFMVKVGVLWITNSINPAQEHFMSNLVRQKLIAAIDGASPTTMLNGKKCLLYLPENELHEITLLFTNLLLKKEGYKTIYLGQSVPYTDLAMVYKLHQPDFIVTVLTSSFVNDSIEEYLQKLSSDFPKATIYASGYQLSDITYKLPTKVKLFKSPFELIQQK